MEFTTETSPLEIDVFSPFGQIIAVSNANEHREGEGWKSWNSRARIEASGRIQFGIVSTSLREPVSQMERHLDTWEFLMPHGAPIVVAVGPPAENPRDSDRPDPRHVRAFVINPDESVMLHPGTWHSPGYPLEGSTTYTYGIMATPDAMNPTWIPFDGGARVRIIS